MPELAHDCRISGGDGFWSRHRDDVSYNQLQKFWSGLPLHAKQALLRIDKQTLFEQARKNMYCSRCNGLLLEGFMQIIMYGKSLQLEGAPNQGSSNRLVTSKSQTVENVCLEIGGKGNESNDDGDVVQDPSVHPWGGLTTTRDGTLTLLDCYICSKSLKGLQNVFDSARARERERELLYPDACGGGGRGWISQGMVGYGRGHGTWETCALHTARLSVDTLVDFWSALGEETRFSLLRMKEEDFMERLMYRFDSKRFCRDCRKNVIREFKELKELKRIRRETRCTSAFCGADTSFQYEVTLDTIHADWHQNYADSKGLYAYYEWAVGTGEGKSDILDFENVGSKSKVQVSGLDLTGLNSCYITLRAWRTDGRRNEACVKAHALKGQHCVHGRLVVGDGFVTISRGESIRSFFEHAEEAEEEEDDDSIDKDGNEVDGECTRPQKHAKSPELAREFLLDAATVIFKEQVEKAFREGTARQNAHSMFVSLALKLLEQRVIVACKDIITLEKQFKLLEEEEKEKRDEEERKERRRAKEKEKKLRRKERLRIKELEKEKKCGQLGQTLIPDASKEDSSQLTSVNNEPDINDNTYCEEQEQEQEEDPSPQEDQILDDDENINSEFSYKKDENQSFGTNDQSKHNRRRLKSWNDYQHDQPSKWSDRSDRRRYEYGSTVNKPVPRYHSDSFETSRNGNKPVSRSNGSRYNDRSHCSHSRTSGRYDPPACNCYQQTYYRPKSGVPEPDTEASKPYLRRNKYNNSNVKKVWEPRSIIDSDDVTDRCADVIEPVEPILPNGPDLNKLKASGVEDSSNLKESESNVHIEPEPESGSTDLSTSSSNSNSDSCSSCLSEGDGNTSVSSNPQNAESSSTSDSEYANHHSEVMSEVVKETLSFLVSSGDIPPITSEPVKESCSEGNNIIPPPLQAQSMHFPVFQPPSMGYYHPGPVPWTTGPVPVPVPVPSTNGLMPLGPLPHSNYSMFASPYVYGNPRYGPYGVNGLQPLGPPLLNHPGQVPMYPPLKGVNDHITVHTKVIPVKGEQHVNSEKSWGQNEQKGNSGFSLFHFGGPVDVSNGLNGFKPDAADSVKDYVKKEVDFDDDCDCGEFKSMEEYDLFNASHGIEFSLF